MKKYLVNVNGTEYAITVEEMAEGAAMPQASAPAAAAPAPAAAAPTAAAPAGGEKISAPMPGTILAVNVSNGQSVKKGDVLMVLEAMKMENEILAPCDGTVSAVSVQKGATVETGALLCAIA